MDMMPSIVSHLLPLIRSYATLQIHNYIHDSANVMRRQVVNRTLSAPAKETVFPDTSLSPPPPPVNCVKT